MSGLEQISSTEYRRLYSRCVSFALSFIFDRPKAEAIASDAMLVLWNKEGKEDISIGDPLPYLFGVVRNKALNELRAEARLKRAKRDVQSASLRELKLRIDTLEACDPHVLYKSDVQAIIEDTLKDLGDKTDTIFRLNRYHGKTHKEIAALMGISEKTSEYHLTRALKALRRNLKEYLPVIAIFLGL